MEKWGKTKTKRRDFSPQANYISAKVGINFADNLLSLGLSGKWGIA
jgi:hypothetical protein